jgi:hypothetical protein
LREAEAKKTLALITMLERGVLSNIGLLYIEVLVHIYIGVPLRNVREEGYAGAGGLIAWQRSQTARGDGTMETLKP